MRNRIGRALVEVRIAEVMFPELAKVGDLLEDLAAPGSYEVQRIVSERVEWNQEPALHTPAAAGRFILEAAKDDPKNQECFRVVDLDSRHRAMGCRVVSLGSLNAAIVHPREVLGPALTVGAAAIIVAHNHPSGDLAPSDEDLSITNRLMSGAELLGITLLDHLIHDGKADYRSMREGGEI